jgi:hypothetical protein
MSNIYFDSLCSDQDRRSALYNGDIFVYSPSDAAANQFAVEESPRPRNLPSRQSTSGAGHSGSLGEVGVVNERGYSTTWPT